MLGKLLILLCAAVNILSYAATSQPPCVKEDNVCLTNLVATIYSESIQGVPALNITKLDPVYDEVVGNLATVQYKSNRTYFTGLKGCHVANTKWALYKNIMRFELLCGKMRLDGDYIISGNILGRPIQGAGDYNVKAKDHRFVIENDINMTQRKDGRIYMKIRSFRTIGESTLGVTYDLKNLFNGNKELGDDLLKFLNYNWYAVSQEMHGPILNTFIKRVLINFNKYLKPKPLDTLILL